MNVNTLILKYKNHITSTKEIKKATLNSEILNIVAFINYIDSLHILINEVSSDNINSYIETLMATNKPRTINSKIRAIRRFLNFLVRYEHLLSHNVALEVPLFKLSDDYPKIIPNSDLKLIIDYMRNHPHGYKLITITKLCVELGLKIGEILSLKMSNIDIENKLIKIRRGKFLFAFPIPTNLLLDLKSYLMIRIRENTLSKDEVFISESGTPYSIRSYQLAFKEVLIATGIKENYSPRNLKATFLKNMAKDNIEVSTLSLISNQDKVQHYYIKNTFNNMK